MIFRAPEAPLAIPEVPLTPFLMAGAEQRGDKPALIDAASGRTLTYGGWAKSVRRTAAGLARRGFRQGDVFAIYSPNLPEYAVAFHAVALLGGVITTVNPAYTAEELSRQMKDAGATWLLTTPPFLEKATRAASENGVRDVLVFGESFESLESDGDVPSVTIDARNDVVALPYSSGSTGLPKGVMLTHHNLVSNILQCAGMFDVSERDTTLAVLPFFHIYGLVVIMNMGLHVGATMVTMPRFDLQECLQAIETHRITYGFIVPPIMLALAKSPVVDRYDLRSLRMLFSGAAPLSEQIARTAGDRLGCAVKQGYGMTEASPATHCTRTGQPGIGQPVQNTESKIVDVTTGAELEPGV